ncbi:MAG: hypothetical protein JO263_09365 [Candidatus Eremiobacteraeota bacterium]|nr:hypothetical protein [Candidatus Eremiobacteraeota bacterium]
MTVTELQDRIFEREGFRVSFERLDAIRAPLPDYAYPVMAPNVWKVSDWKNVRLAPYIAFFKGVTVYRGDGEPLRSDVKLGHLRDGYYAARYGSTEPQSSVIPLRGGGSRKAR